MAFELLGSSAFPASEPSSAAAAIVLWLAHALTCRLGLQPHTTWP